MRRVGALLVALTWTVAGCSGYSAVPRETIPVNVTTVVPDAPASDAGSDAPEASPDAAVEAANERRR